MINVLFPFRNAERFIGEAIDSLNAQKNDNFTVIALNDGSTDLSENILRSRATFTYKVYQTEGVGVSEALNHGLKLADEKYIARMDADDRALCSRFEEQLAYFENNGHADIIGTQAWEIDENGKRSGRIIQKPCTGRLCAAYAKSASPIIHPTLMAKTVILKGLGGYRDINPAQDYELLAFAIQSGFTVANLGRPLLEYRRYTGGASQWNRRRTTANAMVIRTAFRSGSLRTHIDQIQSWSIYTDQLDFGSSQGNRWKKQLRAIRDVKSGRFLGLMQGISTISALMIIDRTIRVECFHLVRSFLIRFIDRLVNCNKIP